MHWWGVDPIRLDRTRRGLRSTHVVLELAWNPDSRVEASLAADALAALANPAQVWPPIGSVVLVASGAGAHPGVGPALDAVREWCPAASVTVVDETVAALAGAGLDPEPAACVVVHLDAWHTSVAVVAGREVAAGGLAAGGACGLAEAVLEHVAAEHRLTVGLESAWIAAVDGGAFAPTPPVPGPATVYGSVLAADGTIVLDQPTGKAVVSPTELRALLAPAYQPVADLVARVLAEAPPETARVAAEGGLLLTGQHPAGAEEHLARLSGLSARLVVKPGRRFDRFRVLLDGVDRLLIASGG